MNKIIFILFITASLVACKKDNDANWVTPVNGPKYKTVTFKGVVTTYTYDQYGRQIKQDVSDGSRVETSYSKGKVEQKVYSTTGEFTRTITITLNSLGLQSRTVHSDKPGNYTEYEYNANKQLAKTISKSGADFISSEVYYTDGNADSTRYYNNGTWYLTNVYTHYFDKENGLTGSATGISYYSNDRKNLMKSLTHMAANGTITPEEYTYDFDAQGRIITLNEVSPNGPSAVYYTYY